VLIFQNGGKTRGKKDRMKGKSMKDAKKDRKEYSQEEREEKEKKERMKQRKKGRTLKSEEKCKGGRNRSRKNQQVVCAFITRQHIGVLPESKAVKT